MPCVGESCRGHGPLGSSPHPESASPVYRIDDIRTESGPYVSLEDQAMLGLLMRHLLPTPAVSRTMSEHPVAAVVARAF